MFIVWYVTVQYQVSCHFSLTCTVAFSKHNTADIVDIIWELIQHYGLQNSGQALLLDWFSSALSRGITDFTVSWTDGIYLLALVNILVSG